MGTRSSSLHGAHGYAESLVAESIVAGIQRYGVVILMRGDHSYAASIKTSFIALRAL
jgi:hypothetical protein